METFLIKPSFFLKSPGRVGRHRDFAALTFNAGHLLGKTAHVLSPRHLWRQNTTSLMHHDHLVGNRYFVPFFMFYTESVMLGPRFILESVFYTQSVMQ